MFFMMKPYKSHVSFFQFHSGYLGQHSLMWKRTAKGYEHKEAWIIRTILEAGCTVKHIEFKYEGVVHCVVSSQTYGSGTQESSV